MSFLGAPIDPLWPVVAGALGVAVGFLLGRIGRRALEARVAALDAETARFEAQTREQSRVLTKLRTEQRAMANLSRVLPTIARELNRSDLDERHIPRLVFALVDAMFEPDQILLYLVRSPASPGDRLPVLQLAERAGTIEVPPSVLKVRGGEGKIGWVAEAKVEMLAEDWLNMTRTDGRAIEDNHPALRLDLLGPLIQHQEGRDQLLGVLCIGSPAVRPRDEKLMLQMVTNLASVAYTNSRNLRVLRDLANHDGLTNLINKRYFMSTRLGLMINAAEREGQPLAIFIFDIDHFKKYNDSNGHLAGDEILRGVAQVLRDNLRPADVACRYGGEEFVVAMPGARASDGMAAAERIRVAIERARFPRAESQPEGRITISGGVSQFPVDGAGSTDLILHADQALYQAKAQGRNRIVQYRGVDIGGDGGTETLFIPHVDARGDR